MERGLWGGVGGVTPPEVTLCSWWDIKIQGLESRSICGYHNQTRESQFSKTCKRRCSKLSSYWYYRIHPSAGRQASHTCNITCHLFQFFLWRWACVLGASGQLPWLLPGTNRVPWPILLLVQTFFQMEGGKSELMEFTVSTLKAFFKACSPSGSGNQQELTARATGCPKMPFFLSTHAQSSGRSAGKLCKDTSSFFHPDPPSPFPCNSCKCNSSGNCSASQF